MRHVSIFPQSISIQKLTNPMRYGYYEHNQADNCNQTINKHYQSNKGPIKHRRILPKHSAAKHFKERRNFDNFPGLPTTNENKENINYSDIILVVMVIRLTYMV